MAGKWETFNQILIVELIYDWRNHSLNFPWKTLTLELKGFPEARLNITTCPQCQSASEIGPFIIFQNGNLSLSNWETSSTVLKISEASLIFNKVCFRFSSNVSVSSISLLFSVVILLSKKLVSYTKRKTYRLSLLILDKNEN